MSVFLYVNNGSLSNLSSFLIFSYVSKKRELILVKALARL